MGNMKGKPVHSWDSPKMNMMMKPSVNSVKMMRLQGTMTYDKTGTIYFKMVMIELLWALPTINRWQWRKGFGIGKQRIYRKKTHLNKRKLSLIVMIAGLSTLDADCCV